MENTDIIFAKTVKDKPGFCEVFYYDGTSDFKGQSIGEIKHELDTQRLKDYFRLTRSAFVCLNNIVMIHPSEHKLVIAFDSLEEKHMELSFSDDVLRQLRKKILNHN